MITPSGCPGLERLKKPVPENIKCIRCGSEEEIWSDESSVACYSCGGRISKQRAAGCEEWCSAAGMCFPALFTRAGRENSPNKGK